jgi:hypothetical protein
MGVRIDQEQIAKYADKVFLAAAVAFLIFAAVMLAFGGGKGDVTYSTVDREYKRITDKRRDAGTPKYIKETLLADDPMLQKTAFQKPLFAKRFTELHEGRGDPWHVASAAGNQVADYAPYKAIWPIVEQATEFPRVVSPDKRVAPERLMARADMRYSPSGKEGQGLLGQDIFFNTIQAEVDVRQQLLWCREAAKVDKNPQLYSKMVSILLTGYDVQRQVKSSSGAWSQWKDVKTVDNDTVNPRKRLPIVPVPDGKAALHGDPKGMTDFLRAVSAFRNNVAKYQAYVLQPPFYPLAGLPDNQPILPYDEIPELQDPEDPAGDDGDGFRKPAAAAGHGFRPAVGQPPAGGAGAVRDPFARMRKQEITINDRLSSNDVGRTFRYRVRIRFLNPLVGLPAQQIDKKHPEEPLMVELAGPWSEPTGEITLPTVTRYFLLGGFRNQAIFCLYRWYLGSWHRAKSVSFTVGDVLQHQASEEVSTPKLKGDAQKLPRRVRVDYSTGMTLVDTLNVTVRHMGHLRPARKAVLWDPIGNRLVSRVSVVDSQRSTKFWKDANTLKKAPARRQPRNVPGGRRPFEEGDPGGPPPTEFDNLGDPGGPPPTL